MATWEASRRDSAYPLRSAPMHSGARPLLRGHRHAFIPWTLCAAALVQTGCGGVLPALGQPPERVEQFSVEPGAPRCQSAHDTNRDCVVLVNFQSDPWVDIFLDAQYVGRTPLLDVRVKARAYKVRLVNPGIKLDYSYDKQFNPTAPDEKITLTFNPQ